VRRQTLPQSSFEPSACRRRSSPCPSCPYLCWRWPLGPWVALFTRPPLSSRPNHARPGQRDRQRPQRSLGLACGAVLVHRCNGRHFVPAFALLVLMLAPVLLRPWSSGRAAASGADRSFETSRKTPCASSSPVCTPSLRSATSSSSPEVWCWLCCCEVRKQQGRTLPCSRRSDFAPRGDKIFLQIR
jgi:hypothetical protein